RRLRVPLQGYGLEAPDVGPGLRRRLYCCHLLSRCDPGWLHRGRVGKGWAVRRRRARLALGVLDLHRVRADRYLRITRQYLADHEGRWRYPASHESHDAPLGLGIAGLHRCGQPVDTARARADREPLVQLAKPPMVLAGATASSARDVAAFDGVEDR